MTHNYYPEIDQIIKSNKIYRFEAELEDSNNIEIARSNTLKNLIEHEKSIKNPQQIQEEKMQEHLKVLMESQYKTKWNLLNITQKLTKLDEFITHIKLTDENIITTLRQYTKDGIFKMTNIKYNVIKGKIEDIDLLKINDDKKYYLIDLTVKTKKQKINTKNKDKDGDKDKGKENATKVNKIKKKKVDSVKEIIELEKNIKTKDNKIKIVKKKSKKNINENIEIDIKTGTKVEAEVETEVEAEVETEVRMKPEVASEIDNKKTIKSVKNKIIKKKINNN